MPHAIKTEHVSRKFARSLKRAMTYGLIDIAKAALIPHRFRSGGFSARLSDAPTNQAPITIPLRPTEFWALSDVSFEVERGECIGIIGHNGAGKSTLFSILSGIYGPTIGRVEIHGKLQALIALGAGFHQMLSGRENIYINAAILGMKTKKIDSILENIIDFSELHDFIDAPIKNYSSGMLVRLGFSVAAHMEPDLLLVDEVLAVGDMSFQRKCLEFMQELYKRDTTVILVSHNMALIETVSNRVLWLDKGRLRADGRPGEVIAEYSTSQLKKTLEAQKRDNARNRKPAWEMKDVLTMESIRTTDLHDQDRETFLPGEPIVIRADYFAHQRIEKPYFHLTFSAGPTRVFDASMLVDGRAPDFIEGRGTMKCVLPKPSLMPNAYKVNVAVRSKEAVCDLLSNVQSARFMVSVKDEGATDGPCSVSLQIRGSLIMQDYEWKHTVGSE